MLGEENYFKCPYFNQMLSFQGSQQCMQIIVSICYKLSVESICTIVLLFILNTNYHWKPETTMKCCQQIS